MHKLWQLIVSLTNSLDLDFSTLTAYIAQFVLLGIPPIQNKSDLRDWLTKFHTLLTDIADVTSTQLDDNALILLHHALTDDEAWDALYDIIACTHDVFDSPLEGQMDLLQEKTDLSVSAIAHVIDMLSDLMALWTPLEKR